MTAHVYCLLCSPASPDPDVGLPGECPEPGLVPAHDPALGHGAPDGGHPAPGVVGHLAPLYLGVGEIILEQGTGVSGDSAAPGPG